MDPITDFHSHAFPDGLAAHAIEALEHRQSDAGAGAFLSGTISDLLRSMDAAGIHRSVICSIATAPKQVSPILQWSRSIRSERIIPFGSLHPDADDPASDVARVAESGLRGVKLHPLYQGFDLGDQALFPLFEAIEEAGLILVLHCGLDFAFPPDDERAHPAKVLAIHRTFPHMPIVAAHMGGWRRWEAVLRTLAGTEVYFETSYSIDYADPEVIQRIIGRHPVEQILLGSDSPWQGQAATLRKVRALFPNPADQEKILVTNPARLLSDPPL